jgi:YHS domain-containing protein
MTPLRLLILALLFYLGWYLLRNRRKKKPRPSDAPSDTSPQDILVEDPVCHLLVPKHQALRLRKDGVTYYFCSEQCCDQFAAKSAQGDL